MAIIGGAAIAAGGTLLSSSMQSGAASDAASTQAGAANQASAYQLQAAQEAIAEQQREYNTSLNILNPNRQAGNYAMQGLEAALGLPLTNLNPISLGGSNMGMGGTPSSGANPANTQMGLGSAPQYYVPGYSNGADNGGASFGQYTNNPNAFGAMKVGSPQYQQAMQQLGIPPEQQMFPQTANAGQQMWAGGSPGFNEQSGQYLSGTKPLGDPPQGGNVLSGTSQINPSRFSNLLTPFNNQIFQQDPGYQFALSQGMEAIQNNAAAKGMLLSPNTIKDLESFSTGLAQQDYQNAFNRYTSQQNQNIGLLESMAGIGQSAAGQQAGITSGIPNTLTNTGAQIGQNMIGAGNALAAGQIGSSNALAGGVSNLGQVLGQTGALMGAGGGGYGYSGPGSLFGGSQFSMGSSLPLTYGMQ